MQYSAVQCSAVQYPSSTRHMYPLGTYFCCCACCVYTTLDSLKPKAIQHQIQMFTQHQFDMRCVHVGLSNVLAFDENKNTVIWKLSVRTILFSLY